MSDTSARQFQQYWSELLSAEPAAHRQAFSAFEEQLAAFTKGAGVTRQSAASTSEQAILQAFQAFGRSALRPPGSAAGSSAACARFTVAASGLQSRLARANVAAATEVQVRNTGRPPRSLQELFDRWVECYEQHLLEVLTDAEFGAVFGDAVNAALECYRDTVAENTRQPAGQQQTLDELRGDVESLAARVADLDARLK
jgi:polyhydroxyalkanoate synthesis regulator phasin